MSYTNLNNPANYQLQSFGQDGMRTISTTQAYVEGEYYRVLVATEDSTLSATSMVGDDLASIDVYAGTTIYGLFTAVTVTAGEVTAYLAGRTDIDDVWAYIRAYGEAGGATIEGEDCAKAAISPLLDKYYAKASLVMVPSLYKTSIVYSERPLSTDGELTFTRASSATRVGPDGLIQRVRTNLFTYSNTFSNAAWTNNNFTLTSGQADPFGGANAWKAQSTSASQADLRQVVSGVGVYSIYAKAGNFSIIQLWTGTTGVAFDLSAGTAAAGGVITSVGNGWYRCSVLTNTTGSFTAIPFINSAIGDFVYIAFAQAETGDIATDYIPTTTASVSVGPVANLPRLNYPINSDGSVGCPSLLLEPQRTNSITSSESTATGWTFTNSSSAVNQTTSPDGYVNADSIIPDATSGQHAINSANITASGSFTLSAFVKAGEHTKVAIRESANTGSYASFNLATGTKIEDNVSGASFIQSYGNGWYRIGVTGTYSGTIRLGINVLSNAYTTGNPSSGTTFFSGNASDKLFCWGMQCELGATYATSYIPTLGTSVTRGADACSKTGISSLIGQTEGTLFVDFESGNFSAASAWAISVNDGTTGNHIGIRKSGSTEYFASLSASGVLQAFFSLGFYGGRHKVALAYSNNDVVAYVDGVLAGSDTSATIPATSVLDVGNLVSGRVMEGAAYQALLFKTRLTNAQLAELTTL